MEEHLAEKPSSPPPSPSSRAAAVSKIAVAQICLGAGYSAAEARAINVLSDIAARYIQTLARAAASAANARGRTDVNVVDLIRGLEELSISRGFTGGSDPTRPLLRSVLLKEMAAFVEAVEEVPFAKPLPRRRGEGCGVLKRVPSFAEAGREPPLRHVPRWLPCFPESWEVLRKRREVEEEAVVSVTTSGGETKGEILRGILPPERKSVGFRMVRSSKARKVEENGQIGRVGN
ncbi:transcription initiation factor TFIID subunit 8-like [Typha latifolia]|uniref:transcription initiation factor TFIID subunit 8-like n=1 Tax=Typha latifolia TaxID=4733 RepID=UPI003C2CCE4B